MANITYNPTSSFGNKIAIVVRDMKEAQQLLQRCLDMMNNVTVNGTQKANVEGSSQFGVAAGQGAAFYDALASLNAALFANTTNRTPLQATIDLDIGQ